MYSTQTVIVNNIDVVERLYTNTTPPLHVTFLGVCWKDSQSLGNKAQWQGRDELGYVSTPKLFQLYIKNPGTPKKNTLHCVKKNLLENNWKKSSLIPCLIIVHYGFRGKARERERDKKVIKTRAKQQMKEKDFKIKIA